jgi:hypothetical protein
MKISKLKMKSNFLEEDICEEQMLPNHSMVWAIPKDNTTIS